MCWEYRALFDGLWYKQKKCLHIARKRGTFLKTILTYIHGSNKPNPTRAVLSLVGDTGILINHDLDSHTAMSSGVSLRIDWQAEKYWQWTPALRLNSNISYLFCGLFNAISCLSLRKNIKGQMYQFCASFTHWKRTRYIFFFYSPEKT